MSRGRKDVVAIAALTLLGVAIAACGGGESTTDTAQGGETATSEVTTTGTTTAPAGFSEADATALDTELDALSGAMLGMMDIDEACRSGEASLRASCDADRAAEFDALAADAEAAVSNAETIAQRAGAEGTTCLNYLTTVLPNYTLERDLSRRLSQSLAEADDPLARNQASDAYHQEVLVQGVREPATALGAAFTACRALARPTVGESSLAVALTGLQYATWNFASRFALATSSVRSCVSATNLADPPAADQEQAISNCILEALDDEQLQEAYVAQAERYLTALTAISESRLAQLPADCPDTVGSDASATRYSMDVVADVRLAAEGMRLTPALLEDLEEQATNASSLFGAPRGELAVCIDAATAAAD
jgi:hypothetical protein